MNQISVDKPGIPLPCRRSRVGSGVKCGVKRGVKSGVEASGVGAWLSTFWLKLKFLKWSRKL
jgi:hypothetical protein